MERVYLTLSTCSNSSSTGVARPKIETETMSRLPALGPVAKRGALRA
jgi:hypothetical protein